MKAVRDPAGMTPAEINRELERIGAKESKLGSQMIAQGRGHERPSETVTKDDPLAQQYKALWQRRDELLGEVRRRAGPGFYRMPHGLKRRA